MRNPIAVIGPSSNGPSRSFIAGVTLGAVGLVSSVLVAGTVPPLQPRAGDPLPGLTAAELELFETGKVLYSTPLAIEDGLGPIFNKAGCFSCHAVPLGGWGSISVTRFGTTDGQGNFDPLDEMGGSLLQVSSISQACQETIPEDATVVGIRVTNASLAYGMVEAIPDAAIAANADEADLNGDGISGRVRWVTPFESKRAQKVGRFGWKSQIATVLSFSADASRMEMGLSNRFIPTDAAPNGDEVLLGICDSVPDPEDGPDSEGYHFIDRITHFQRYLGVPPQTPKSGMTGEAVFNAIGCAQCHIPEWTTSNNPRLEAAIRNKTIRPYSDFLLHEISSTGDGIADEFASGSEFRTPTLWNLRTRDPMLHNGAAAGGTFEARVVAAIEGHSEGEAAASYDAFSNLPTLQQEQLIAFLGSLGRIEFDMDGDNQINYADVVELSVVFGATGVTPDDPEAVGDVDQDGDIDLTDALAFDLQYPGPSTDCNRNGIPDIADIVAGTSLDADQNGLPDECVACPADLNNDGGVDGADLATLLGSWGGTEFDLTGDNVVDGADLAIVLGAWGLCK